MINFEPTIIDNVAFVDDTTLLNNIIIESKQGPISRYGIISTMRIEFYSNLKNKGLIVISYNCDASPFTIKNHVDVIYSPRKTCLYSRHVILSEKAMTMYKLLFKI